MIIEDEVQKADKFNANFTKLPQLDQMKAGFAGIFIEDQLKTKGVESMICKSREVPLHIQKLKALARRVRPSHEKYSLILEHLSKRKAGYKGEQAIEYPLSYLPHDKCMILHDLRLYDGTHYFQPDTIIIFSNIIFLLEVKNYAGRITFGDSFKQCIQTLPDQEKVLPNPIQQLQRQKWQLEKWLNQNHCPKVPIYPLAVMSNPQAILHTTSSSQNITSSVIRVEYLYEHLYRIQKQVQTEILTTKDMKRIVRLLKKQNTQLDTPILQHYGIPKDELIKGVQCPICDAIPALRRYGSWFCLSCQKKSRDAHLLAFTDYKLLISSEITNKQLRDFFKIDDPALATRILHAAKLSSVGVTKDRIYTLE